MSKCKNCKFFLREDTSSYWSKKSLENFGECSHPSFIYQNAYNEPDGLPNDALIYRDGDGFGAPPVVGVNFGCTHFEEE